MNSKNSLRELFTWGSKVKRRLYVIAMCGIILEMGVIVYAFVTYPDSFFTTSPNFISLDIAAPWVTWVVIIATIVATPSMFLAMYFDSKLEIIKKKIERSH